MSHPLLDAPPRQRAQALLSQARLMARDSWETSLRALVPSLDDPLLLVALARRLRGAHETLAQIHGALDDGDRGQVAGGVRALGAWLSGAGSRDDADALLMEAGAGLRTWIVLLYLCVDLSDEHEQDVLEAYAEGIADNDEPPLSPAQVDRLRGALFA